MVYLGANKSQVFEEIHSLSDLGFYGKPHRIVLTPAVENFKQISLFREETMPSEIISEHYSRSPCPAVTIYGLPGHELGGFGLVQKEGILFYSSDILPEYFSHRINSDSHTLYDGWCRATFDSSADVLDIDKPVAVALHPNLVYGHFLLEMLPRLYLLSRLKKLGVVFAVCVPNEIPIWAKAIINLFFEDTDIVKYDANKVRLRSKCFILPSMMHTNYNFHPDFNLAIEDIMQLASSKTVKKNDLTRVWLSRGRLNGNGSGSWRGITNEYDVENAVRRLGFTTVHMQELSFIEQVRVMTGAHCIASEYSSATHNSIFAHRGTKVFCVNRINWYQSGIGRLRSQPLAYLPPADGIFRDWRVQGSDGKYLVNCADLSEQLDHFANN